MAAGLKQLLLGDVEAGTLHMQPIHCFLTDSVVFANDRRLLDGLEPQTREALLAVVAGYLPYYTSEAQVGTSMLSSLLPEVGMGGGSTAVAHRSKDCFARCVAAVMTRVCPAPEQGLSSAMESFPSPEHTLDKGGHRAGEAADYGEWTRWASC